MSNQVLPGQDMKPVIRRLANGDVLVTFRNLKGYVVTRKIRMAWR
jgi:hypothetical protein